MICLFNGKVRSQLFKGIGLRWFQPRFVLFDSHSLFSGWLSLWITLKYIQYNVWNVLMGNMQQFKEMIRFSACWIICGTYAVSHMIVVDLSFYLVRSIKKLMSNSYLFNIGLQNGKLIFIQKKSWFLLNTWHYVPYYGYFIFCQFWSEKSHLFHLKLWDMKY